MSTIVHGIDPTRVRAAVFDLGGVFLAGGVESVASFGSRHGVSEETWTAIRRELFDADGIWAEVERGERPFSDFTTRLRVRVREHGGAASVADAANFMGNAGAEGRRYLRAEIVAATERVHARMPTALLTNNIREWRDGWRSLIAVEALFDVVIDSSEVGTRKPEPAIYELTRAALGLPHQSLFFVDDLGTNLKTARALGWQTLRYDNTAQVLEVLDTLAAAPS